MSHCHKRPIAGLTHCKKFSLIFSYCFPVHHHFRLFPFFDITIVRVRFTGLYLDDEWYIPERVLQEFFSNLLKRQDYKQNLHKKAGMMLVSDMITDGHRRGLGLVVRRENINNAEVSLTWSHEVGRRDRPKTTWHCTVESEWRRLHLTLWMQIENVVQDHVQGGKCWHVASHTPLRC